MQTEEGKVRARQTAWGKLKRLNWSNADLASAAGVDPATVGDFLGGKRWPRPATLDRIETALGLTPGTLAGLGEEPPPVGAASELSDADLLAELTYRLERQRRELDELKRENDQLRAEAAEPPRPLSMAELKRRRLLADAMPVEEAAYEGDLD